MQQTKFDTRNCNTGEQDRYDYGMVSINPRSNINVVISVAYKIDRTQKKLMHIEWVTKSKHHQSPSRVIVPTLTYTGTTILGRYCTYS
jgi:hypothetical protein